MRKSQSREKEIYLKFHEIPTRKRPNQSVQMDFNNAGGGAVGREDL